MGRRRGHYHLAGAPPYVAGYEGAGVVEALHPDAGEALGPLVYRPAEGDRVAFADAPFADAELVAVPLDRLVPVPAGVSLEAAAALLLQGLTAQYLARDSYAARPGTEAVVHAAAGGVGQLHVQLLVQLLRHAGARVLGLASSARKRAAAPARTWSTTR